MKTSIATWPTNRAALVQIISAHGFKVRTLLSSPEANPKVAKNGKVGVMTWPMHLSPFNLSGHQVCPAATAGCAAACLHTAGNPAYMTGKTAARLQRTRLFFAHRDLFAALLVAEIRAAVVAATRAGMQCGIRLNATSDICFESLRVDGRTLMEMFPMVEFYDYTKIPGRVTPANYTLTFSLAEDNDEKAHAELARGVNVAVVLDVGRNKALPQVWQGRTLVDGDVHDFRPADGLEPNGQGRWIGLRAKGKAIGDASGFVRAA